MNDPFGHPFTSLEDENKHLKNLAHNIQWMRSSDRRMHERERNRLRVYAYILMGAMIAMSMLLGLR